MSALSFPLYYPNAIGMHGIAGNSGFTAFQDQTLSTDRRCAAIGRATKSGNIHKVHFRTGAALTTDADLDVRIETVGADGRPTGTLWGTNTNGTSPTSHAINTTYTVTLTADAAVNRGDMFAVVIRAGAGVSVNMGIIVSTGSAQLVHSSQLPRNAFHNSISWTLDDGFPHFAVEMDDGSFMYGFSMFGNSAQDLAYNNGSSADEEGNYFVMPFSAYAVGAFARVMTASSAEFQFNLYDSSDTPGSALASAAIGCNNPLLNNRSTSAAYFSSRVFLKEGNAYQICVQATTANTITMERVVLPSASMQALWPYGAGAKRARRTVAGPGTFSYLTDEVFVTLGIILDEIVSLRRHPGMAGGMVA